MDEADVEATASKLSGVGGDDDGDGDTGSSGGDGSSTAALSEGLQWKF